MPQPFVDPLPVQSLAALLGIRLKLRLQGGKLCKWRIWIRLFLAPVRTGTRILTSTAARLAVTLALMALTFIAATTLRATVTLLAILARRPRASLVLISPVVL